MQEHIRAHERITDSLFSEKKIIVEDVLSKPVILYLPSELENHSDLDLLFHFHGTPNVPIQAVEKIGKSVILVVINQGSGSSAYMKPFQDTTVFTRLIEKITEKCTSKRIKKIYCSAFSAGYGAVRELLKTHFDEIDGVLLLDGMHTDYIPEATPLANGGIPKIFLGGLVFGKGYRWMSALRSFVGVDLFGFFPSDKSYRPLKKVARCQTPS